MDDLHAEQNDRLKRFTDLVCDGSREQGWGALEGSSMHLKNNGLQHRVHRNLYPRENNVSGRGKAHHWRRWSPTQ